MECLLCPPLGCGVYSGASPTYAGEHFPPPLYINVPRYTDCELIGERPARCGPQIMPCYVVVCVGVCVLLCVCACVCDRVGKAPPKGRALPACTRPILLAVQNHLDD